MRLNPYSKVCRVLVCGVGIITAWLMDPPVYAEINFQDMKGLHELINPKYEYLSPIHGLTLLGTKTLENMRFAGNYGPKKEGLGCLEKATQIHQLLIQNHDCPQDKTAELIQRFFPSQDGVNFVANQLKSDPVSHLGPEVLGKLLSRLAHVKDSNLIDEKKSSELQADLKNIMYAALNPREYYKALQKRSTDRAQKLKSQIHQLRNGPNQPDEGEIQGAESELEKITTELVSIKDILKQLNLKSGKTSHSSSDDDTYPQLGQKPGKGNESEFEEIASLLVSALKESRIPGPNGTPSYPKHLPEQILLAYFWKKADEKRDFIRLFNGMVDGMPQHSSLVTHESHSPVSESILNDPAFLTTSEKVTHFLSKTYSKTEFHPEMILQDPMHAAKEFLANPEELVFYAQQEKLENPPVLSYAQASHSSLKGKTYSDCGETSLRNFLNIIIYDKKTGRFDAQNLIQLQEKNSLSIHPNLISFYQKHSDAAASVGQRVRDDWSETITSKHEGVIYNKPSEAPLCEISSSGGGIDNMLVVLDRLLFHGKKTGLEVGKTRNPNSILSAKDRAGKLDALCKAVSRDGFELSWNLEGSDSDLEDSDLEDSDKEAINRMKFGNIVFSVNENPSFIWQFKPGHFVVQEIHTHKQSWKEVVAAAVIKEMNESRPAHSESTVSLLLHWLVTEQNFDQLAQSKQLPSNSIYTLPLTSDDGKLFAFRKIIQNQMSSLYSMAKKLQKRLPKNDIHTQLEIETVLADHDYPLGERPHAYGKSDVKYPRVTHQERELLVTKHGKSFDKARITPRGWIIGDVLQNEDGSFMEVNWKQAIEECKKRGAVLLPEKEYKNIGKDFLYGFSNFFPQFLPHFYGYLFWSSSPSSDPMNPYRLFDGSDGRFSNYSYVSVNRTRVRCGVKTAELIR